MHEAGEIRHWDATSWPSGVFGGKADNLRILKWTLKLAVPPFFAVSRHFSDQAALTESLRWLGENRKPLFAVRSSGLQEDSDESAMAGANDTVLNCKEEDVWDAILKVRSSSKTEKQIPCVVQLMRAPFLSGVAFSRHPVLFSDLVVINVGSGLGEAVVSGHVDPTQLIFEKDTTNLRSLSGPPLERKQDWTELVKRVVDVEAFYQKPVDCEWCIDESGLWMLQARPVTSFVLYDVRPEIRGCIFANDHTKEVMGKVLTPLTWTAFRCIIDTAMRARSEALGLMGYTESESYYELIAGRLYQNVNLTFELYKQEFGSLSGVDMLKKEFSSVPPETFEGFQESKSTLSPALRMGKMIWGAGRRSEGLERELDQEREYCESNAKTCDFETAMARLTKFAQTYVEIQIYCFLFVALLEAWQGEALPFLSDLDGVETAIQADQFGELIRVAREHGLQSEQLQEQLGSFRRRWGFRAVDELELASPRWKDDPTYLVSALEGAVAASGATAAAAAVRTAPQPMPRVYGLTSVLVTRTRSFCRLRENSKAVVVRFLSICRDRAVERAQQAMPEIDPQDVFYLTLAEYRNPPPNIQEIVRNAKKRQELFNKLACADAYVAKDGTFLPLFHLEKHDPGATALKGVVASAPVMSVTGRARVISDPQKEGHLLQKGEILICATTDPAWTLLFWQCGAIVSEKGGLLSHAAITAREMRVPCLVGVKTLLQHNLDGKDVTLDLRTGTLLLHDNKKEEIIILDDLIK